MSPSPMRLKVCGIETEAEITLLGALPVQFVGLWHGVPGGSHDLELSHFLDLAAAALDLGTLEPVLVTFLSDPKAVARAVVGSGLDWVQLHGFQSPAVIGALRGLLPETAVIVKALHIQGNTCLEAPFLSAYEKAGVDAFLFDTATADGRIGSTGVPLNAQTALSLADRLSVPFLAAGGVSAQRTTDLEALSHHRRFFAFDVDSAARASDGTLSANAIAEIATTWKAVAATPRTRRHAELS